MATVHSDASYYDGLPDQASDSGTEFETEDEGVVEPDSVAPPAPASAPLAPAPAPLAPAPEPVAPAPLATHAQPAPPLPTVFISAPLVPVASSQPLVRTASNSGGSSMLLPASTSTMPSWEEFLNVTKTSLVTTHTMMQQAAQVIVRLDQRQDRMEQNQDQMRVQLEQQQQQLGQLRNQLTQNMSRRPDGELSREVLMLVEFIVRYGMDTKRGHVVAFPVMVAPRAGTPEKLFLAICTPLVHEAFLAMFKEKSDAFKNKTVVNDMLNNLNHQPPTADHRFLDKLFAHLELRRNMPLKKVFVLADVRYFFSAWQSVQGREQLHALSALDLSQLSFSRNQRSVWTDEAETHWAPHDPKYDAKFLTKMAWNLPVQREVLVAHSRAVHAFMREIATLQDREAEWQVPPSEVFHFCGFTYVSPHEVKVKKAVALLPRSRHDRSSSSSSSSSSSGEEEESSGQEAEVPLPRSHALSGGSGSSGGAGAGAPRVGGKELAVLLQQQKDQEQQKRRRAKAGKGKRSKRRRERSSSDTDDRVRASDSGSSGGSSSDSSSSDFEDAKTLRRKKSRK